MTTSQQQPAERHHQNPAIPPTPPYPGQIPPQWTPQQGQWPQQWPNPHVPQQRQPYPQPLPARPAAPRDGLAITALALGLFGVLSGLIQVPITAVLAFILGGVGVTLGVIALSRAGIGTKRATAITGTVLSALALVLSMITVVVGISQTLESSTSSSPSATASAPIVPSAPIYTSPPTVSAPPVTDPKNLTTGMYEVGADIPAGKYKTTGPLISSSCYYERSSGDGGSISDIVDNGNVQGPGMFTAKAGETVTLNGDCVWKLN